MTSEELAAAAEPDGSSRITDGMTVVMAGQIIGKKNLVTKSSRMMAFVDLEDLYGEVEVVVFPNVYERCAAVVSEDNVVAVKGRLNFKEDEMPKLLAESVVPIEEAGEEFLSSVSKESGNTASSDGTYAKKHRSGAVNSSETYRSGKGVSASAAGEPEPVKVRIPQEADEKAVLAQLSGIFSAHRGNTPVLIYLQNGKIVRTGQGGGVYPSIDLFDTVAEIVGRPNIKGRVRT